MDRSDITGLVLAGGRGSRMGGVDKGLQPYRGRTLAEHALQRLAPQVGRTMISANRHLAQYRALGVPVWPDAGAEAAFEGPLAGVLVGLERCETPWLATVPCDTPGFPADLVERLADAINSEQAEIAMAATRSLDGSLRPQPVFCLMRRTLAPQLKAFLAGGERKSEAWSAGLRRALVAFDEVGAFANANTWDELTQLQGPGRDCA